MWIFPTYVLLARNRGISRQSSEAQRRERIVFEQLRIIQLVTKCYAFLSNRMFYKSAHRSWHET